MSEMTGLERLRALGREQEERSWSTVGKVRGRLMGEIARQIEDEQEALVRETEDVAGRDSDALAAELERKRRAVLDDLATVSGAVIAVARDMERHVLGHEDMQDSHVARWARELREALGGREEEVTDVATVRKDAYDAYEWVQERGGLEALSTELDCLRGTISETCARVGAEHTGDLTQDAQAIWREINLRLMPEGMEWPRFEDNEPVRIGDEFMGKDGKIYTVKQIRLMGCYFSLYDFCDEKPQLKADYGERIKRAAPKALDADGVEIRKGECVWRVGSGESLTVDRIEYEGGGTPNVYFSDGSWDYPDNLTHRAPVLAADGRPLREGETVWHGDERMTVNAITGNGLVQMRELMSCVTIDPRNLTHEQPDSLQKLWDDLSYGDVSEDEFMRRVRKLAERGQ